MQNKAESQKIAQERIEVLFGEADSAAREGNLSRANRYIFLARKLSMKFSVRLSREQSRKFCHKCYKYLQPGKNLSVKINPKTQSVEYLCKECGSITRYPYIKEKHFKQKL
jgi:ribonuclease P protein subunit RPR2